MTVMKARGASLLGTLLLSLVLLVLLLSVASTATFHLQVSSRQSNLEQARNLAESAVALATARLSQQPDFGTTGTADERSLSVTLECSPGGRGRLTFHPGRASSWGIRTSFNNAQNDTTLVGDGRTLPPFSAQLIGVGEVNGVTSVVETIVHIPHYKFALATSGTLSSTGGLLVASVDDGTDLSGGISSIPQDQLLPGHVAANAVANMNLDSTAPNPSMVTGDAQSGGSVTLGPNTTVDGSILQNAAAVDLPDLDVADYDPVGWVGLFQMSNSTFSNTLTLEGPVRRAGDLTVSNGGLELESAYLYVDGDLTINGGISGTGAIFCTGDVLVSGASTLAAENVQAIAAAGDLSISGYGQNSSYFQGVLYSRGNVDLSDVTVVGSTLGNGPPDSTFAVDRVNLITQPQMVQFDWRFPFTADQPMLTGSEDVFYVTVPDDVDLTAYFDSSTDSFDPNLVTASNLPLVFRVRPHPSYQHLYEPGHMLETSDLNEAANWLVQNVNIQEFSPQEWIDQRYLPEVRPAFIQQLRDDITNLNDLYQSTRDTNLIRGRFTLDPNEFIQFSDKVRVVWSAEVSR